MERLIKDLHRDDALELEVDPAPHGPHAALADLFEDLDPTGEDALWVLLGYEVRGVLVFVEEETVRVVGLLVVDLVLVVPVDLLRLALVGRVVGVSLARGGARVVQPFCAHVALRPGDTTTHRLARSRVA
ncbi:MAG TPA: hypothetical protein VGB85_12780 [Nannocystis sp.]